MEAQQKIKHNTVRSISKKKRENAINIYFACATFKDTDNI